MTPSPPARSSAEKVNGKPPARAAFCIQNAAVAAFQMRRRRGAVRSAASAAPRAISAERKASVGAFSTPLSFPHGKESAVDGRKKGWQRGSFESPPLQTPLKRPRRGLRPPSLDFPRSLVCAEIISDYPNVLKIHICQTGVVVEILCGCFGCDLNGSPFFAMCNAALARKAAYRLPYVKYSTGANRTIRTVCRALGKPDSTAARRAFLFAQTNDEWQAELIRFYGASALFRVQRLFSPHSFLARQKRMGRRRHPAPFRRIRNAPPEAASIWKNAISLDMASLRPCGRADNRR